MKNRVNKLTTFLQRNADNILVRHFPQGIVSYRVVSYCIRMCMCMCILSYLILSYDTLTVVHVLTNVYI